MQPDLVGHQVDQQPLGLHLGERHVPVAVAVQEDFLDVASGSEP